MNDYAESFLSRLRDEFLEMEEFENIAAAQKLTTAWKDDYNHHRPHSSLGYVTPIEFAACWAASAPKLLSATPQATSPRQQPSGITSPDSHNTWCTFLGQITNATQENSSSD